MLTNFFSERKIFDKNPNFRQKSKFLSKIQILDFSLQFLFLANFDPDLVEIRMALEGFGEFATLQVYTKFCIANFFLEIHKKRRLRFA